MGTAGTVAAAVAGVAILGIGGRVIYMRAQQPVVAIELPSDGPDAANSDAPAVDTEPQVQAVAEPETQPVPELPPLAGPRFDLVRVEPDGTTVVAGSGQVGALVALFLDNVELDTAEIDASGKFVLLLSLKPSDKPRLMTMSARLDGQEAWSEDQIVLSPTPTPTAPEPVAEPVAEPVTVASEPATEEVAAVAQPAPEPAKAQAQKGPEPVAMAAAPDGTATPAPTTAPATPAAEGAAPQIASTSPAEPAGDATGPGTDPDGQAAARPKASAAPVDPANPAAPEPPAEEPGDVAAPQIPDAPGPVAVLRAGADGVELLQPGTPDRPEALDRLALDTISYSENGEVLLAGRAPDGSAVRVYLDNEAVADLPIGADGRWKGEVPGVRPGVYTLRLDQVDSDGSVDGRIETPFKRESPAVLAAARAEQPASDPITAVTVQRGDTLWAISQNRYGSGVLYVRVFEANRDTIRDPDLIYPGQVFAIPN